MQGGFFMFNFLSLKLGFSFTEPNPDSGDYFTFTKEGKIAMIIISVLLVLIPVLVYNFCFKKKNDESVSENDAKQGNKSAAKRKAMLSTKELVVSAVCIALAYVCSSIKFFEMPYGGSITLFSMFFMTFIGYCFGLRTGVLCGLAYGVFQLIQDPWLLSPLQICFDYLFAFAALGLSGIFRNLKTKDKQTGEKRLTKYGLIFGYAFAAFARGISHVIGGYLFWMDSMPEKFPKSLSFIYPFVYNFSFIGAEMIMTVIVLMIPGVAKVFIRLRREANS